MPISSLRQRLLWLTVYGAAFGYVEAVLVVYLRELFYPGGFAFPISIPDHFVLPWEHAREWATMAMLLAPAMLVAPTGWGRFGAFAFLFGVWDLAYYLGLWLVLGWPSSLFTWDLLFLVPRIWAGPVLSAAAMAVSLVAAGVILLEREAKGRAPRHVWWGWPAAAISLGLLLWAFMANDGAVREGRMPEGFPWGIYAAGYLLGWAVFGLSFRGGGRAIDRPGEPAPPDSGTEDLSDTRF